MHLVFKVLM